MYRNFKAIIDFWKESDAEDRKDIIEGFVGMASLLAICFMLSGVMA